MKNLQPTILVLRSEDCLQEFCHFCSALKLNDEEIQSLIEQAAEAAITALEDHLNGVDLNRAIGFKTPNLSKIHSEIAIDKRELMELIKHYSLLYLRLMQCVSELRIPMSSPKGHLRLPYVYAGVWQNHVRLAHICQVPIHSRVK